MTEPTAFYPFPKIPRLRREAIVTEKIDGTNACIRITEEGEVLAQSRTKFITPEEDNHGFARWVSENEDRIRDVLGTGVHFGEWWGGKIQRGYGVKEKRFSLFNPFFFENVPNPWPEGIYTVPIVASGILEDGLIERSLDLLHRSGSLAAPGWKPAEGIVVYHTQAKTRFKVLLDNDNVPKAIAEAQHVHGR